MSKPKYEAVTASEMIARLGVRGCSPMHEKEGYVIGPDVNGRLCHVASCDTMARARQIVRTHEERESNGNT